MTTAPWIQTFTGKKFPLFVPTVNDINIVDIAHGLSLQCRFAGHVREFYSVAEHSVRVSREVPQRDALWGLLHDASESFISDMSRPLKRSRVGEEYLHVEQNIMLVICDKFGLPYTMPESVHLLDRVLLRTEQRDLLGPSPDEWDRIDDAIPLKETIVPWSWQRAEIEFLKRFEELTCSH